MKVLSLVNGASSTSFEFELSEKIHKNTDAHVEIASFYLDSTSEADSSISNSELKIHTIGAKSRFDLRGYRKLRNMIDEFDILHTHFNFVGSVARSFCVGKNINVVNTEHADHRYYSTLQNIVNLVTYPKVDYMIYNSQSTQESLHKYELPFLYGTESRIIHNGIDFDRIRKGQKINNCIQFPDGDKIVTASRLVSVKNIETIIKAMNRVLAQKHDSSLIIIGDGPQKEYLKEVAKKNGIEDSVIFLGHLEREMVYNVVSQCDIFVVSSLYEGFCNAAVEAMGCRLPVVASDIDVLKEVIGEDGRFANPNDSDEFASELISLLENKKERIKLANKAQRHAKSKFGIETCVEKYYRIYDELTKKRPPS